MPKGIIVFGANGSGKTTVGRELARILHYRALDIEDYAFARSRTPYGEARSREECRALLLDDIQRYGPFVLSAVDGDFGEKITSMLACAVRLSAPPALRLERIKRRAYHQYGERVCRGGDLFEQEQKFYDFVAARSFDRMERWEKTLPCPVVAVENAGPLEETMEKLLTQYQALFPGGMQGEGRKPGI